MTWLDMAVIFIILTSGIIAFHRGFIKTLFSFISLIAAVIITMYIYPYFSEFLIKNTGLFDLIKGWVINFFDLDIITKNIISPQEQLNFINQMELPNQFKDMLIANNNSEVHNILNVTDIASYIGGVIATLAINIIAYIVVFIAVIIVLKIIVGLLDLISKLPVLHQINKLGGLIIGVLIGIVIVWFLCLGVTIINSNEIIALIDESSIAKVFYNNNLLMRIVTDISKTIISLN